MKSDRAIIAESQSWWTVPLFALVILMGFLLAWFVNSATTQIQEALAEEVLQQQHDVASLLHEYEKMMIAIEHARESDAKIQPSLTNTLLEAQQLLEKMRFQYTFERLDGAATAHALAQPVIEDVSQWIIQGVPGKTAVVPQLLEVAVQRMADRYPMLQDISDETDEVAQVLISDQSDYLHWFRSALLFLLGFYVLLASGFAALLVRQKNLQSQLRLGQQRNAERITDFADIGADWFWELSPDLKLNVLSNQGLTEGADLAANDGIPSDLTQWPTDSLRNQLAFQDYESEWQVVNEHPRTISISGKPLFDDQNVFMGFRGIGRDITDRKDMERELESVYQQLVATQKLGREQAEEALRDTEQFLSTSIDAMASHIAILDKNGKVKAANSAWRALYTDELHDDGIGYHYLSALDVNNDSKHSGLLQVKDDVHAVLSGKSDSLQRTIACHVADQKCWMELELTTFQSNEQRYAVVVYDDITARLSLEEEDRKLRADLAHVARLNTAGEMASILAHEINQPLTAINHNCYSLLSNFSGQSEEVVKEILEDIYEQSQRSGDIIHSMRQMMRKDAPRTRSMNINQLVRETNRLTTPEAREHSVKVRLELEPVLPAVMIDSVQIQQVLVNLERNAVEAMRYNERRQRELVISTKFLPDQNMVRVSVSDTGPGIMEDAVKNLFSSFHSTKKDGMGMGLSISRSIVEAHGGQLWHDQSESDLTTFHFELPTN